jgi:hypothetical protein
MRLTHLAGWLFPAKRERLHGGRKHAVSPILRRSGRAAKSDLPVLDRTLVARRLLADSTAMTVPGGAAQRHVAVVGVSVGSARRPRASRSSARGLQRAPCRLHQYGVRLFRFTAAAHNPPVFRQAREKRVTLTRFIPAPPGLGRSVRPHYLSCVPLVHAIAAYGNEANLRRVLRHVGGLLLLS